MNLLISVVSFLIVLAGFLYGASRLLFKKKPLFFKLLVLASGCYAMEELSVLVNYLTDGFEYYITLGSFGIFGTFLFMLSVNFGALDRISDEGRFTLPFRMVSLAVSFVLLILVILITISAASYGIPASVILFVVLVPVVPASYYTAKHILLPSDSLGLLKITRLSNISAMVFYFSIVISILLITTTSEMSAGVFSLISAISVSGISIFAARGERKWQI